MTGYQQIDIYVRTNRRYYETYSGPSSVAIVSTAPDVVSALFRQHIKKMVVVNRVGHVVSQLPTRTISYDVVMIMSANRRWYLSSVVQRQGTKVGL